MKIASEETLRCPSVGKSSMAPHSAKQRPWQGGK